MNWRAIRVAADGTHHVLASKPIYDERFDKVLKFHEPGLAPVRRQAEAWHIQPNGSEAYRRRFKQTFGFYEGLAAVSGHDGWHHILPNGSDLYQARYAWCGNYQEGRCTVRDGNGAYFHLSTDGTPAYESRWHYAGDFRDGIGVVQADNGRSTHIDLTGRPIHDRWFLDLDVFHKGFARARDEDGWTHVDLDGQPAYRRRFASVEPFYNGLARVERLDGGLEVIDEAGQPVVELRPALRSEFATLSSDMVGFWRTQTICTAVELGVFESLPGSYQTVAKVCGLNPERAQRLLRALAELQLTQLEEGQWKTTKRGEYLKVGHPLTLADAAIEYGRHFPQMWLALPDAIRANAAWQSPDVFGVVAESPARAEGHHRMLLSYALHDYTSVPAAMRLEGDERVVDAGGGLGGLASFMVQHYPRLQIVVLDRPEVIEHAAQQQPNCRIDFRPVDLFQPWNVEADAVVMARILHDWDNSKAIELLRNARSALPTDGRIFVVEMLVQEDTVAGSLCDLHLLMTTGGRERTVREYQHLFDAAGFSLETIRHMPALPSIIVGVAI